MFFGDIQVDFCLMMVKFIQGINKVNNNFNDLKCFMDLVKCVVGGLVVVLVICEVGQFVSWMVEVGVVLDQVFDCLGVIIDWFIEMIYVVFQYGVQNDVLIDGIKELLL